MKFKLTNGRDVMGVTAETEYAALDAAWAWANYTGSDHVDVLATGQKIGHVERVLEEPEA